MSFEPNKKHFLAQLREPDFEISTLKNSDDLQEILWYLDDGRSQEIIDDLFNQKFTTRKEAEQIIKNLAKIYPLSKSLVMKIMATAGGNTIYRDAAFLEGFDAAGEVRKAILATFKEIESRLLRLTRETDDYQKSLARLKDERDRLQKAADNLAKLRTERDNLQKKIEELQTDADADKLREQMDGLQVTIQQLESERHRQQTEIAEKQRRTNEIKAELDDLSKRLNSSEELQMIKDLLKKFPADAED